MSEYGFLSIDEVQHALEAGVSPHSVVNINNEPTEDDASAGPMRPGEETT